MSPQGGGVTLEVAGHDYTGDKLAVKMALSRMESMVGAYNDYDIGPPSARFGWTFFMVRMGSGLQAGIESRFAGVLAGYSKEKDPSKRLAMFVSEYLAAKGHHMRVKAVES